MISHPSSPISFPQLDILPVESLILHEEHDRQRSAPLIEKLRGAGVLRNPPIVMPLADGSQRYMVLDGANRVTSLRALEFPHLVAQIAQADNPNVNLQTWNHVVWGMSARTFMNKLGKIKGLEAVKVNSRRSLDAPKYAPVQIRLSNRELYLLMEEPSDLPKHIETLHTVVNAYKTSASLDRTSQTLIEPFRPIYKDLTALIIFPRFKIRTLLKLTSNNIVLPTGITRFTVSPRALHVNYPLHELSSGKPIDYKREYLKRWVDARVEQKGVRLYAEATYLFDE